MLKQCEVRLGRSAVQHAGPQEAAAEVDDALNVLLVSLHVCCDGSLLQWDSPTFLRLAVNGVQSLCLFVAIRLSQNHHVCPVRIDHSLYNNTQRRISSI